MGMYTELNIAVRLNIPKDDPVAGVLSAMAKGEINVLGTMDYPGHPFFKTERWRFLFRMSSYYFNAVSSCQFEWDSIISAYVLSVRSSIKNYDSEIEHFLNWIHPYVVTAGMWGYYRYEESALPTIIMTGHNADHSYRECQFVYPPVEV